MIKILHIVSGLNAGGVETLLYSHYELMNKKEFKFDVAVTCGDEKLGLYAKKFEDIGSKVYRLPSKKKIFRYHRELKKILKENKYDIIHVHQDEKSFQSLIVAKSCGVRTRISHAHHCYKVKGLINRFLRRLTWIFSTHQFACSDQSAKFMFGKSEHVFIMKNAIDISKFKYNAVLRKQIRNELSLDKTNIIIGTVARVAEQKNPLFLIDIIAELYKLNDNIKLIYVGNGPLMDQVKLKINQLQLDNVCKMVGEKDDAYKYYNCFDLFLLPSIEEGFGISALEAQSNGLVTIISNGFPDTVNVNKKNVEMLSINQSPKEWAEKIYWYIKNDKLDRIESQVLYSDYCIDKSVKLLENKYKEIKNL